MLNSINNPETDVYFKHFVSSFATFHKQAQVAIFPILEGIILFQILLIAAIIMSKYYMQGLVLLKCFMYIISFHPHGDYICSFYFHFTDEEKPSN